MVADQPTGTARDSAKGQLKKEAWRRYIKFWHMPKAKTTLENDWDTSPSLTPGACNLRGDLSDSTVISERFREKFFLDNDLMKKAFFAQDFNIRDDNFKILRHLIGILQEPTRNKEVCYYPDAPPIRQFGPDCTTYSCPVCSKDLTTMEATSRPNHLLICQRRNLERKLS